MQAAESKSMESLYKERVQIFASLCLEAAALAPGAEDVTIVEPDQIEEIPYATADEDHDHDRP